MQRRALTVLGALVLLLATTVPFVLRIRDPFEQNELRARLLELRGLEAALSSEALQLRLGTQANYDGLMRNQQELDRLTDEFVERCGRLDAEAGERLLIAFAPFRTSGQERRRILEAFPSDNATLNSSLRLLGATGARACAHATRNPAIRNQVNRVMLQALEFCASPDESLRTALERTLAETPDEFVRSSGVAAAFLGHARIILEQRQRVDGDLSELLRTQGEDALTNAFLAVEHEADLSAARVESRRATLATICVLVAILTCAAGAWSAIRQSAALEREARERRRSEAETRKLEIELRQAQKLESIGQLAAGIAHEINTPVQFVSDSLHFVREAAHDLAVLLELYQGLSRQVAQGAATPASAAAMDLAEKQGDLEYLLENVPRALDRSLEGLDRVSTIVRSLKEFAHPDRSEMALVDVNRAIRSTLAISRNEYKFLAEVELDLGELPLVLCHGGSVNQVILNIIVNAAHAIGDVVAGTKERGRIIVRTRVEGHAVLIAITDTGGGIPEAIRERIFDPFFTTKEVGRGTGQGLAIARTAVVEKHGGSLTLETEVGQGSTFLVRLPIGGKRGPSRAA